MAFRRRTSHSGFLKSAFSAFSLIFNFGFSIRFAVFGSRTTLPNRLTFREASAHNSSQSATARM